jgi:NodT family efflux transporter outer membrane factor (OMF) lipoprotein
VHFLRARAQGRPLRQCLYSGLLTAGLLAGCTVGPDYQAASPTLPGSWANGSAPAAPTKPDLRPWWQQLNDPLLDRLVERAVTGNLDVALAQAKIREARATYEQAGGALLPSLGGSAGATRSKSGGGNARSQFQAGFDASWELDLFGANQRTLEAADYGLQAADADLRNTLLTLVGDVASNYINARTTQARLDLTRRTVATQRETADLTRAKYQAGALSAANAASAEGQATSTEAQIQSLESSYATYLHRLGILLGQSPTALANELDSVAPLPAVPDALPPSLPADLLRRRPDIQAAERRLAQSTARIGVAEAGRYPSISLTGSLTTSASNAGDLARSSTIGWSIGPSINIPLFQGGKLQAAVDLAVAQRDQSAISFHSTVLSALEDVENALVALSRERVRYEKLRAAAASYREAAELAQALFRAGSTGFLEVLDAQRSLYSAEDSLVQSQANIISNYITLNKALGGGWDGALPTQANLTERN